MLSDLVESSGRANAVFVSWASRIKSIRLDRGISIAVMVLLGLSLLMVYSAGAPVSWELYGSSQALVLRHSVHVAIGLCCLLVCSVLNVEFYRRGAWLFVLLGILLLMAVLIPGIGHKAGGATRWINLGLFKFQPSEFVKIAIVIYMASYIGRHHHKMRQFVSGVLVPSVIVLTLAMLLLAEPDFGSTAVICLVVFTQLFLATRIRYFVMLGASAGISLILLAVTSPYRFRRLQAFLDPFQDADGSGYQLIQSLTAVGSGGYWGTGLGAGKQKLFYLPAAYTDFIYAVVAEELGLVGAVIVLLVFGYIGYRGIKLACRFSADPFLHSLVIGLTMLLALPALLNMGVVLGLLPTKGLVLPLLSYGGSATIANLMVVGILFSLLRADDSVSKQPKHLALV